MTHEKSEKGKEKGVTLWKMAGPPGAPSALPCPALPAFTPHSSSSSCCSCRFASFEAEEEASGRRIVGAGDILRRNRHLPSPLRLLSAVRFSSVEWSLSLLLETFRRRCFPAA